jgi:hypothetical protein
MSVKKYVKEQHEKRKLLLKLKNIIIEEPKKEFKTLKQLDIKTLSEVMEMYINIGNMSYFTGDNDIFEYFIESLFDIINAAPVKFNEEELIKYIYKYGFMSSRNYNITPYCIILSNIKSNIFRSEDMQLINQHLDMLENLAMTSEEHNYESGTMETLHILKDIDDYLKKKNMEVNRFYLKNIIISVIHSAEKNQHEHLKDKIVAESNEILELKILKDQPEAVYGDSKPVLGSDEPSTPQVL